MGGWKQAALLWSGVCRRKAASSNTVDRGLLAVRACCESGLLLAVLVLMGTEWNVTVTAGSMCPGIHLKPLDLPESHLFTKDWLLAILNFCRALRWEENLLQILEGNGRRVNSHSVSLVALGGLLGLHLPCAPSPPCCSLNPASRSCSGALALFTAAIWCLKNAARGLCQSLGHGLLSAV